MARRLIIGTTCPLCGKQVEAVPDGVIKQQPGMIDAEIVVTRSGYKQYIHSSCWYIFGADDPTRTGTDFSTST